LRDVSEGESEHFFEAVLQALYPKTDAKQFLSDMKTKALASNNKTALEEINHVTEIYIYLEKPMSPSLDIDQTRGD
jgi:hypothetical protein